jgi:hypothetical protein
VEEEEHAAKKATCNRLVRKKVIRMSTFSISNLRMETEATITVRNRRINPNNRQTITRNLKRVIKDRKPQVEILPDVRICTSRGRNKRSLLGVWQEC